MLPRIAIAAVLLTSAWMSQAQCQAVPRPGERLKESFFSLATVAGLPYPSGIELILNETGGHVDATLRDYAGEPKAHETKLMGSIKERQSGKTTTCELDVAGTNKDGAVKIHGSIRPANFLGTIQRRVGSDTYSEEVSLKRRVQRDDLDMGAL